MKTKTETQIEAPLTQRVTIKKILLVLALVIFLSGIVYGLTNASSFMSTLPVVKVENVFVDMNGDGVLDFVPYAEVVINKGNLTASP
jgi:hypothetical protein